MDAQPGLKAQHLTGIRGVAEMYSGVLLGAAIDSMDIEYKPKLFRPGRYLVDIQTAGTNMNYWRLLHSVLMICVSFIHVLWLCVLRLPVCVLLQAVSHL